MANLEDNANKLVDMTYKPVGERLYNGEFIRSLTDIGDTVPKPGLVAQDFSNVKGVNEDQKNLLNSLSKSNTDQANLAVADLNNLFKSTLGKIATNSQDTAVQAGMGVQNGNDLSVANSGRNLSYLQDVQTVAQNQVLDQEKTYAAETNKILAQAQAANTQVLGQAIQLQDANQKWAFQKEQYYTQLSGGYSNEEGKFFDPQTGQLTDKPVYTIAGDQYYNFSKPNQNFTLFQKAVDAKYYPTEKELNVNTQLLNNEATRENILTTQTNRELSIDANNREQIKFANANAEGGTSGGGTGSNGLPGGNASYTANALGLTDQEEIDALNAYSDDNGGLDATKLNEKFLTGDPAAVKAMSALDRQLGTGQGIYYSYGLDQTGLTKTVNAAGKTVTTGKPKLFIKDINETSVLNNIKKYGLNLSASAPVPNADIKGSELVGEIMQKGLSMALTGENSMDTLNKVMISSSDNMKIMVALKNVNTDSNNNLVEGGSANYSMIEYDMTNMTAEARFKMVEALQASTKNGYSTINAIKEAAKDSLVIQNLGDLTGTINPVEAIEKLKKRGYEKTGVFGNPNASTVATFANILVSGAGSVTGLASLKGQGLIEYDNPGTASFSSVKIGQIGNAMIDAQDKASIYNDISSSDIETIFKAKNELVSGSSTTSDAKLQSLASLIKENTYKFRPYLTDISGKTVLDKAQNIHMLIMSSPTNASFTPQMGANLTAFILRDANEESKFNVIGDGQGANQNYSTWYNAYTKGKSSPSSNNEKSQVIAAGNARRTEPKGSPSSYVAR